MNIILVFVIWVAFVTHSLWCKRQLLKSISINYPKIYKELGSPTIWTRHSFKGAYFGKGQDLFSEFMQQSNWEELENVEVLRHGKWVRFYSRATLPLFLFFLLAIFSSKP